MLTNGHNGSDYIVPLLIDGNEITTTATTFDVTSPATGQVVWKAASASKEDALSAVAAAEKAGPAWAKTKPAARRAILLEAADLLEVRRDESLKPLSQETGAISPFTDITFESTVELLRDVAGKIARALEGEIPVCAQEGTNALLVKEPYGVNFGIAPW